MGVLSHVQRGHRVLVPCGPRLRYGMTRANLISYRALQQFTLYAMLLLGPPAMLYCRFGHGGGMLGRLQRSHSQKAVSGEDGMVGSEPGSEPSIMGCQTKSLRMCVCCTGGMRRAWWVTEYGVELPCYGTFNDIDAMSSTHGTAHHYGLTSHHIVCMYRNMHISRKRQPQTRTQQLRVHFKTLSKTMMCVVLNNAVRICFKIWILCWNYWTTCKCAHHSLKS